MRGQLARTKVDHASVLFARNGPGDREHGMRLVMEARATAEELGLAGCGNVSPVALAASSGRSGGQNPRAERHAAPGRPALDRRAGGQTVKLKDGPGLGYLAALVREPGREFHVLDLSVGTHGPAGAARQA